MGQKTKKNFCQENDYLQLVLPESSELKCNLGIEKSITLKRLP